MAFKFLKQRWQRVVFYSCLIFTGIVLLLALLINRYWSPILSDKVKSAVLSGTDSLYKVDFSSAELNVLQGKIIIYNITFKPDTAVYNRRKKQHLAPNNLIDVHVKRLVVSHIHPFKLYFQHVLELGRISVSSPDVHMSYQLNHVKDTVTKDTRTTWQKISKTLKLVHVEDIFLDDVHFKYDDYSGNKLVISELKEMNVHASDLLIDSATQTDKSRLLYCKDIVGELNNYKGKTADGLYAYTIKKLSLSTHTSQLNMEGMVFAPVNAETFFNNSQKDRYTVHLDSLQLNNFNFLLYHKYRSVSASSLILSNGTLDLFNNPNKPQTKTDRIQGFPHVALLNIKTDIKIDTVKAKSINISYSEFNKSSAKTGTIQFNNTSGKFLNITNNTAELQKNNISTASLTSYFMNRARLNVAFTFNLADKHAGYTYKGNVGPVNLMVINPALIPLAMVKITSGTLKSLDFDIKANSKTARGKVTLLYNDLKVKLLKADTADQRLKRKIIETLFANMFILKHDNPDKPGLIPRSFNVVYTRQPDFSFFKMMWQTLLTGIKPAVGYDIKTQQATTAKMVQRDINKQNHQIKKAMRKQKRAERKRKRALKQQQKAEEKAANAAGQ